MSEYEKEKLQVFLATNAVLVFVSCIGVLATFLLIQHVFLQAANDIDNQVKKAQNEHYYEP